MRDALRQLGWTLLRICLGVGLMSHGYAKIFTMTAEGVVKLVPFTEHVRELGFPAPVFFAWAAALSELVGGAFLAVGLFTRFACLAAVSTMGVALYSHLSHGDPFGKWELAGMYLAGFGAYLLGGAGPFSMDAIFAARKARSASSIFR
jgi:putative oxidoreductase